MDQKEEREIGILRRRIECIVNRKGVLTPKHFRKYFGVPRYYESEYLDVYTHEEFLKTLREAKLAE